MGEASARAHVETIQHEFMRKFDSIRIWKPAWIHVRKRGPTMNKLGSFLPVEGGGQKSK